MKKCATLLGVVVLLLALAIPLAHTGAAPAADCEAFGTGLIASLSTLNIPFTCTADSVAYFGVCDSGPALDDFFEINYGGQVVAHNVINSSGETAFVGSAGVASGSNMATLLSISDAAGATYSYGVSTDETAVKSYLISNCGGDLTEFGASAGCNRDVPVFTMDKAPSAGTLEFRVMLGNENSRETSGLLYSWDIAAGQQLNNEIVTNVMTPRYVRLWWQPDGGSEWFMLTSQYWNTSGTKTAEYGLSCGDGVPSYHTSFASAVPEEKVCFDLMNGCN